LSKAGGMKRLPEATGQAIGSINLLALHERIKIEG
jgi:hypothetical protein